MTDIKDYRLIGDLHTAALVSPKGSIDWLCFPEFDSPSVFARILDEEQGGFFEVIADGWDAESGYLQDTAILETVFRQRKNRIRVRDFMVPKAEKTCSCQYLVRNITSIAGGNTVRFRFSPRPDYARKTPIFHIENRVVSVDIGQKGKLFLHLPPSSGINAESDRDLILEIEVPEGETRSLVMEYAVFDVMENSGQELEKTTREYWQDWVGQGEFFDFCRERLSRSAITLKLMQFFPTGAFVAAPTTSLPTQIGGGRNWDYRYMWLRDATFGLYAFHVLGYDEEARHLFHFIETLFQEHEDWDFSVLYRVNSQDCPQEEILPHLTGHRHSPPVRIGNDARHQFQLDMYGALIDAYYFTSLNLDSVPEKSRQIIKSLVKKIEQNWMKPDSGIWEARNEPKHYTYSKVMAWVGMDRAVKMCHLLQVDGETHRKWEELRDEIHAWIWGNCFDRDRKTVVQYPGTYHQDATNFLFVLLHFLDKHDPMTKDILRSTADELLHDETLVSRYKSEDGLNSFGGEGAFVLCSFWMISAYAILEETETVLDLFRKLERRFAPSNLIAEQIDPSTDDYLGNFPQAFSHLGYIMSAYYLSRYRKKEGDEPLDCDL